MKIVYLLIAFALAIGAVVVFLMVRDKGPRRSTALAVPEADDGDRRVARLNAPPISSSVGPTTMSEASAPIPQQLARPVSIAEKAESERQVQGARIRAHSQELRDSVWAPAMEAKVQKAFANLGIESRPELLKVDCRHTSCVADLQWPKANEHPPDLLGLLGGITMEVPCARFVTLDPEAGSAGVTGTLVADCEAVRFGAARVSAGERR